MSSGRVVSIRASGAPGLPAARQLGATAVQYPRPVGEYEADPPPQTESMGIRIGIIARERGDEAWTVARSRFPEDRRGQIAHRFAMSVSDSEWHQQLSQHVCLCANRLVLRPTLLKASEPPHTRVGLAEEAQPEHGDEDK